MCTVRNIVLIYCSTLPDSVLLCMQCLNSFSSSSVLLCGIGALMLSATATALTACAVLVATSMSSHETSLRMAVAMSNSKLVHGPVFGCSPVAHMNCCPFLPFSPCA